MMKGPKPRLVKERFWEKVKISKGCWEWTSAKDKNGYGLFYLNPKITAARAHRLSWEFTNGPIKSGKLVCHTCDNPSCVNPDHLWIGTVKENTIDMVKKGRNPDISGRKNPAAKWFEILDPEGNTHVTDCLKTFADKHELSYACMQKVSQGKNKQHRGFKIVRKEASV